MSVRSFLITIAFFAGLQGFCQSDSNIRIPSYKYGDQELMKFLTKNISYSHEVKNRYNYCFSYVTFVVTKEGNIENIKMAKSCDPEMDAEAIRVVKLTSGNWFPGTVDNVPVDVQYNLPIKIIVLDSTSPSDVKQYCLRIYNKGVRLYEEGKIDEAFQMFTKVIKTDPGHTDALYNCAVISIQRGDTTAACDYLNTIKLGGKGDADDLISKYCVQK